MTPALLPGELTDLLEQLRQLQAAMQAARSGTPAQGGKAQASVEHLIGELWERLAPPDPNTSPDLTRLLPLVLMLDNAKFDFGDPVQKRPGGGRWRGRVTGFYCGSLTPLGYAVESELEEGSVQIYPEKALETRET